MNASALTKIYERWLRVLTIVRDDKGDNAKIDMYRGELFNAVFGALLVEESENGQVPAHDDSAADEDDDDADNNDDDAWPEGVHHE